MTIGLELIATMAEVVQKHGPHGRQEGAWTVDSHDRRRTLLSSIVCTVPWCSGAIAILFAAVWGISLTTEGPADMAALMVFLSAILFTVYAVLARAALSLMDRDNDRDDPEP